ncbi:MAG: spore coat protein U domain-containing protein [Pseudomonas sp.]|nr:spore coat protein U domain-containing protein [Pseudomonas sp.]
MIRRLIYALLLCGTLVSMPTYACSTYAGGSVNLGNTNSLSLRTTQQQAAAGAGLACPGLLQVLAGAYVRVTLQNPGTLALQDGQGNQIPFQVFQDAGYNQALVAGQPQQLGAINLLALGGNSTAIGLYFRTNPGPNVPAGTYTATITLRWDWAICTVGALNICAWNRSPGLTQSCVVICGAPTNWGTGSLATPGGQQSLPRRYLAQRGLWRQRPDQPVQRAATHLRRDLHQHRGLHAEFRQRAELPGALATPNQW